MGIKLVVSDVDGTLIDCDDNLSPAIDELAEILQENDIKFTLASGRTPPMMNEFTRRLHITLPIIVCNGSAAYHQGEYIWKDFLNPMEMLAAISFADSLDMAIIISDGDKEVAYRHNAYIQRQIDLFGKWSEVYHPSLEEYPSIRIQKLLIIDPNHPGRIDSVIRKLDVTQGTFNIVRYDSRGIEIMPNGGSKGNAIRRLAKYLGVDMQDILAVGNEINDVDMLEAAGIGVAVANAAEGLKEHANYICQHNDIHGVIEAVKKFCIEHPKTQETQTMKIKNVILDCDPGADDAIAIILALHSPELNILGITAVSGVCHVDQSSINAVKILEKFGKAYIPVAKGAKQPLKRTMVFDQTYCGMDGLSETGLLSPEASVCKESAYEFIIEQARKHSGNIHIISTGPMTNIAFALTMDPAIKESISSIITSSGSYGVGQNLKNKNPRPTWNILQDPEAAKIVMESGILIEGIGLDVTSSFKNDLIDILLANSNENKFSKVFLEKAVEFNLSHGLEPYSLLVDSVAVAYAIEPDIAKMLDGRVAVETKGELTLGQTLFGNTGYLEHMKSKIKVAYDFDQYTFVKLLSERVF